MEEIDSSFNTLVEGTDEWNSKLIESNTLIAEIISQFPEMSRYLTTINGRMQFETEGWDKINKAFEERLQTAANLQIALNSKANALAAKANIENTNLIENMIDGISEENKIKVAELLAKSPAALNYNPEQLQSFLFNKGVDIQNTQLLEAILAKGDELVAAYNAAEAANQSADAAIKSTIETNLSTKGITGSSATVAASIAAKSYDAIREENDKSGHFWSNGADEAEANEWAEALGFRIDDFKTLGKTIYTNLATGEQEEISNEMIATQLADLRAQQGSTEIAERLAQTLETDNRNFADSLRGIFEEAEIDLSETKLSDAFSGILDGDTLVDENLINAIIGNPDSLEQAVNDMLSGLSDDEKASKIADYLGEDIEEVKKDIPKFTKELVTTLDKNTKEIQKVQTRQNNKLRGMLGKSKGLTAADLKLYEENPELGSDILPEIDELINSLTQQQKNFLLETGEEIASSLGEESLKPFFDSISMLYSEGDEAQIKKVTSFIEDIDFSNPIQATKQLKLGINSDIDALSNMSEQLLETGKSSLDTSAQFQYLYSQESFSDISEEIDKMVLEEGKIDGSGVLELTEKSSELKDMIDNTGISVETLGQTFTALSKGKITLLDLNSGVMDVLASCNQLDGVVQEASDFIGDLDLGIDTGKLSEDLHSTAEEIIEMYEGGEYGNPQIENFIKQFFGEDRWNQALQDAKGDLQIAASQFMDEIKLIDDNLYSVWASFDEKSQERLNQYNKEAGTNLQFSQLENGTLKFETNGATTKEAIQGIMEAYQVTEEYANLILTDFMNNSRNLRTELAENDWTAGLQEYLKNNKFVTYENGEEKKQSYINANDIETLSKVTGKEEIEYWRTLAEELGITTEKLKTVQEIKEKISETHTVIDIDVNELDEVREFFGKKYKINFDSDSAIEDLKQFADGAVLDLDKVQESLESLNVPQDVIDNIKQEIAQIWSEGGKDQEVKLDNVTFSADEVASDIQAATEKAAKQVDYTIMGEAMAKALSEIEVDYDTSNFTASNTKVTNDLKNKTSSAITNGVDKGISTAKTKWNNWVPGDKDSTLTVTPKLAKTTIKLGITDGKTATLSTYKYGTDGLTKNEKALVGEIGPELAENPNGTATLYGVKGPVVADLKKGTKIHNAKETKKILKGNNNFKTINRYATGYEKKEQQKGPLGTSSKSSSSSSKSSSNSSSKTKKELLEFSEALDKLYNTYQRINKELRMVNKYQERYERLLESTNVTGQKLLNNLQKQQKYYNLLLKRNTTVKDTRLEQIEKMLGSKAKYKHEYEVTTTDSSGNKTTETKEKWNYTKSNISKWFKYDKQYGLLTINWEALEKLRTDKNSKANRELYDHLVNDILPILEGYQGDIEEANDNLEDAKNALEDMKKEGRDAYERIEERVYSALVQREQEKIDKLTQIDESINDANSDLINSIQDSISKIRQDRENQETEDDIAAKERRLAYLRRDTSNANALEIKQLEEELADQKQDYTDTLIDQKISELQEQNDEAATQRQQQIDLLQAQLDYDEKTGYFWQEAHDLIREGIDETGKLVEYSQLVDLLKSEEGWEGLSAVGKMTWYTELRQEAAEGWLWLKENWNTALGSLETLLFAVNTGRVDVGDEISFNKTTGKEGTFKGTVLDNGKVYYEGSTKDNVHFEIDQDQLWDNGDGTWTLKDGTLDDYRKFDITNEASGKTKKTQTVYAKVNGKEELTAVKAERQSDGTLKNPNTRKTFNKVYQDTSGKYYTEAAKAMIDKNPEKYGNIKWKYKEGGLADFTGPAWLDGTKSKPEMVLNSRDTENFIQLKDVLRSLLNGNNLNNSSNSGDNYYEIHIEVDKLENDYDVDQVAEKVKKIINSDARYRNVNSINRLR